MAYGRCVFSPCPVGARSLFRVCPTPPLFVERGGTRAPEGDRREERRAVARAPRGACVRGEVLCAVAWLPCLARRVVYFIHVCVSVRPKAARALPRAPPNGLPVPLSSNEEPPPTSRPIPSLSYPVSYGRGRSQHPRLLLTTEGEQGPRPVEALPVLILMCGLCFPRSPTPS